ncbi:MAG: RNA-binding protein [Leucobacter sp.]|nr:RNA-binding protein [Leucobacter sp.]
MAVSLAEVLEHLVRGISSVPESVRVDSRETNRGELLEVRVDPRDLGRVIGRGGRTAQSLRTVISALSDGRRVRIDVVDTDSEAVG